MTESRTRDNSNSCNVLGEALEVVEIELFTDFGAGYFDGSGCGKQQHGNFFGI